MTKTYSPNPFMTPEAIDILEESMKIHECPKCKSKDCDNCESKRLIEKLRSEHKC